MLLKFDQFMSYYKGKKISKNIAEIKTWENYTQPLLEYRMFG